MGGRRLKAVPFLALWLVLVVGGTWLVFQAAEVSTGLAVAVGAVAWLAQVPLARARINDLGRSPDDVLWVFVPVLWQVFALVLLAPTPRDEERAKRIATWHGQLTGGAAFLLGARQLARVWYLALVLALVFASIQTFIGDEVLAFVEVAKGLELDRRQLLAQVLFWVAGGLGLYTLVQFVNRSKVSRVSWIPSLFALPIGLMGGGVFLIGMPGTDPARYALVYSAWGLISACIGGAALAIAWITIGQELADGRTPRPMAVLRRMLDRTPDVAGPHGAKVHAVQIGLQVVVPGIFYAVQMAFVDMVAVLEPDAPALKRSARLTWGIRTRVLKVLLLGVVFALGAGLAAAWVFEGPAAMWEGLIVPGATSLATNFVGDLVGILSFGAVTLGLLAIYRERVERLRAREAAKADQPAEPPPPVEEPSSSGAPLAALGLLMAVAGGLLLSQAGTGLVMASCGVLLGVLALLVGRRG